MKLVRPRIMYGISAVLLLGVETLIAIYFKKGFIRHWLGDFLVVALLYALLQFIWPGKILNRILWVGVITVTIEILQAVNFVELIGLQDNLAAKLILGTTFSWSDLMAYGLGLLAVYGIERLVRAESFIQCREVVLCSRKKT